MPQFLATLAICGNVRAACKDAGIDRRTAYNYRSKDDDFAERWESALQEAADVLEEEGWNRALGGSDLLLMFMLKGLRPEKYREKAPALSPAELDRLIESALEVRRELGEGEKIIDVPSRLIG